MCHERSMVNIVVPFCKSNFIFICPFVGIAGKPGRDGLPGVLGYPGPKGMKGDHAETGGIGLPGNDSLKCCQIKIIQNFLKIFLHWSFQIQAYGSSSTHAAAKFLVNN